MRSTAAALDVLEDLDHPVPIDASDPDALARSKRLELLRIAARDLLGLDTLETVGRRSPISPSRCSTGAASLGGRAVPLAVIGMGKLGGRELNYASDVDVLFVSADGPRRGHGTAHPADRQAGASGSTPTSGPKGRAGPLTRSLDELRAPTGTDGRPRGSSRRC